MTALGGPAVRAAVRLNYWWNPVTSGNPAAELPLVPRGAPANWEISGNGEEYFARSSREAWPAGVV
jgi:hypothetical protein